MKQLYTVVCGRIGTNCYILTDENKDAVIFDVPDSSGEKIAKFCEDEQLKPLAVLLTHGHFDHCGGAFDFLCKYSVPVYGNKEDFDLASRASKNRFRISAKDCTITNFVADGDCIEINNFKINVMHTPGHTMGSVCYFVDGLMFSGDTLFHGDIGRTDFAESNPSEMIESLRKIKSINTDFAVYPGHEESTALFEEKKTNSYLKNETLY